MEIAIALFILECIGLLIGYQMRVYAISRNMAKRWIALIEIVVITLAAVTTATAIYIILIILGIA